MHHFCKLCCGKSDATYIEFDTLKEHYMCWACLRSWISSDPAPSDESFRSWLDAMMTLRFLFI